MPETETPVGLQEHIPADVMIEQGQPGAADYKKIPMRDLPFIKETKDVPSLAKQFHDAQAELGRRIRLPGKDAKPEEVKAIRAKLTEAGLIESAPAEYTVTKPGDGTPESKLYDEEQVKAFLPVAKELGLTQKQADALLVFDLKRHVEAQEQFNKSKDEGLATLKKEFGDQFETASADATRIVQKIFTADEIAFYEQIGVANDPRFLAPLMRLAPLAKADSSFLSETAQTGSSAATRDDAKAELSRIMSDTTHPHYAGYHKKPQDEATVKYIQELYKKVAPGTVEV